MKDFDYLCSRFHQESHYAHVPLDLHTCRSVYLKSKMNPNGRIFTKEYYIEGQMVGLFIGSIVPIFFSKETQAQDLIFYILPEHRGTSWFLRTLLEFEKWAKEQGAFQVVLYTDTGINPEKLGTLLGKYKYTQSGVCYNKEI